MIEQSPMAPIAIFVYNRPIHTRKTIEALLANAEARESVLYIFCDGPKGVADRNAVSEVRRYIGKLSGFAEINIVERENNLGLANSVISGVSKLCDKYGKVIVLEDDLITSPYFLKFMNDALNIYEKCPEVASISGYMYPVQPDNQTDTILIDYPMSWGWATWQNAWNIFDADGEHLLSELKLRKQLRSFDNLASGRLATMLKGQIKGKNNSWFIRWCASNHLQGKLTLAPSKSLVSNIGIDGTGTHCSSWVFNPFDVEPSSVPLEVKAKKAPLYADKHGLRKIKIFFIKVYFMKYLNALFRLFISRLDKKNNH